MTMSAQTTLTARKGLPATLRQELAKKTEIQATPEYRNQSADLRREIDDRVRRFKQELKDKKLDPDSLREKIRSERERQKNEMKRIRDEMRGR